MSRFTPNVYAIILICLIVGGLFSSGYLVLSHYRNFTNIGYQSFCAISRSLNCDTVSQSPYAVFAGAPLAVWGMVGYLVFLAFLVYFRGDAKLQRGWAMLFLLAAVFSLVSVVLAIVSSLFIRSYCLMCLATYGINLMLVYFSWLASRRFGDGPFWEQLKKDAGHAKQKPGRVVVAGVVLMAAIAVIAFFYPKYWMLPELTIDAKLDFGVTEDESPWIGAQQPLLTITEFSDYMCFQCGKMHSYLRQLVNQYPDRIRLVHRNFPLDHRVNPMLKESIHPNSGLLALFSIAAEKAGAFWPVNDMLYRDARKKRAINFGRIAKTVGMDLSNFEEMINDKQVIGKLERDIRAGLKLKIAATPTYVIDGVVYAGTIPENVISRAIKGN